MATDPTMENKKLKFADGLFYVFLGLLLLGFATEDSTLSLMEEDGLVEWLSVLFWSVGFVVSLRAVRDRTGLRSRVLFVSAALICLVALGEETSWGQRVLDFDTPGFIKERNKQGEFNFHNLEVMSGGSTWRHFFKTGEFNIKQILDAQNLFRLFMLTLFFVCPVAYRFERAKVLFDRVGYVNPRTGSVVLLWGSITLVYLITLGGDQIFLHSGQEIREMIFAYVSASYVFYCSERLSEKEPAGGAE